MSAVVTSICLLLGFPVAYLLASLPERTANVLLIFVLLPDGFAVMKRTADVKAATTEPAKH